MDETIIIFFVVKLLLLIIIRVEHNARPIDKPKYEVSKVGLQRKSLTHNTYLLMSRIYTRTVHPLSYCTRDIRIHSPFRHISLNFLFYFHR